MQPRAAATSVGFGTGAHVVSLSGVSVSVPVSGFVGLLGSPGELSEVDVAADNPFSAGIMLLKNVSYPGGPLSSPTNPIFPVSQCGPSCYNFVSPITPEWYDPPLAGAYTFISQNGKFTSINAFPTGFSGSFLVSTPTGNLGSFGSGQSVQFAGGTSQFTVSGISPGVDGTNPIAFPINLSLDTAGATFSMQAVSDTPEPSSWVMGALGLIAVFSRKRNASSL